MKKIKKKKTVKYQWKNLGAENKVSNFREVFQFCSTCKNVHK